MDGAQAGDRVLEGEKRKRKGTEKRKGNERRKERKRKREGKGKAKGTGKEFAWAAHRLRSQRVGTKKARCTVAVGFPISYRNFCSRPRESTGIICVCVNQACFANGVQQTSGMHPRKLKCCLGAMVFLTCCHVGMPHMLFAMITQVHSLLKCVSWSRNHRRCRP